MKTSLKNKLPILLNFFAIIPIRTCYLEEGNFGWNPRRSRSQVNLKFGHLISSRSCAGTVKKCTKKRDARAELLFCSLNLLLFWRSPCSRRCSFVRSLLTSARVRIPEFTEFTLPYVTLYFRDRRGAALISYWVNRTEISVVMCEQERISCLILSWCE